MEKSLIPRVTKFGKWTILILLAFILVWPLSAGLYWVVYKGYTIIDPTRFPELDQNIKVIQQKTSADSSQPQKGAALSASIRNRLEQEMNSTFGWIIAPTGSVEPSLPPGC